MPALNRSPASPRSPYQMRIGRRFLRGMLKLVGRFLPWVVLCVGLFFSLSEMALVNVIKYRVFDFYQEAWPRETEELPVYVVDIDEKSLAEIGQWPWPRVELARLITVLFETYKIRVLGMDMVLAEPDRTSPEHVTRAWQLPPDLQETIARLPQHDAVLAKTIKRYPVVLGVAFHHQEAGVGRSVLPLKAGVASRGDAISYLPHSRSVTRNLPALEEGTQGLSHFNMMPEVDNVVRAVPAFIVYQPANEGGEGREPQVVPTLSLEMLRLALEERSYLLETEPNAGLTGVRLGRSDVVVPLDREGRVWPRFTAYERSHYVSASDVMQGRLAPDALQGGLVLVGTSASGLFDLRASPINPIVPGVDIHKQTLETVLSGTVLQRPWWSDAFPTVFLAVTGVLLIVSMSRAGAAGSVLLAFGFVTASMGASIWAYRAKGILLDATFPTVTLLLLFMVLNIVKYWREEASKKQIRNAFAHYLSPDLVRELARSQTGLSLGGEQKEMTVLFSDIRGFTSLSEGLTPQALTQLLNRYLTPMSDIILQEKGTIDKYMGDAIMAFWNAPLNVPHHPQSACRAALEMLDALKGLNKAFKAQKWPQLSIGIGINTGVVTVGNMGSDQRFDYTVMGDAVNLASRLEGLCKVYGVPLIISEATYAQLGDEAWALPLDKVAVQGKSAAVTVYALLALGKPLSAALEKERKAVIRGYDAYLRQDWHTALSCYASLGRFPKLRDMFVERIEGYRTSPPQKGWDGTTVARTK